jgi:hypothetical protein
MTGIRIIMHENLEQDSIRTITAFVLLFCSYFVVGTQGHVLTRQACYHFT